MASDLPPKSVSADMDRIFKPLSERAPGDSLGQGRSLGKARAGGKRDLRVFTMVAPALVLVAGYAISITLTRRALQAQGRANWVTLATMPVYWVLMSAAAWLALWQFITRPFHWNKTEHGLSSARPFRWRRRRRTG